VESDLVAVERILAEIQRKQGNLSRALAQVGDAEAATPLVAELKSMGTRKREMEAERERLQAHQASWQESQDSLKSIEEWMSAIAFNIDSLTYNERRDLLTALDVKVKLYRADHTPRFEIMASIPLEPANIVVTRCSPRSRPRGPRRLGWYRLREGGRVGARLGAGRERSSAARRGR